MVMVASASLPGGPQQKEMEILIEILNSQEESSL